LPPGGQALPESMNLITHGKYNKLRIRPLITKTTILTERTLETQMRKIILLLIFISFSATAQNKPFQLIETPRVDKRIEMLSIVFRLAGNFEYNMDQFKEYVDDIHKHFDKYKEHPVVLLAQKLADSSGVGFDAVMAMAIHLSQPPELEPLIPFSENVPEKRWGKESGEKFVRLLKQFYKDAHCDEFFEQHEKLYTLAAERFKTVFEALDISWYKEFYGELPQGTLNIRIGLGNGGGNYGPKVVMPDGSEHAYAIMGAWSVDKENNPVFDADSYLPTLIHEFCHSFVNHIVERHNSGFEKPAQELLEPVMLLMQSQAYPNWNTVTKESLVRASVIRYIVKHSGNSKQSYAELNTQLGRGFVWMKGLSDTLAYFEKHRELYPTFESYFPSIISYYEQSAKNKDALFSRCAHVAAVEPFNNYADGISSDLKEMKIVFDKEMNNKGVSIIYGKLGETNYPIVKKGVSFTDGNKAVIIKLELKANTKYQFVLTGNGFKSAEGYPLLTYPVEFTTK
jgi:hypothetical protein